MCFSRISFLQMCQTLAGRVIEKTKITAANPQSFLRRSKMLWRLFDARFSCALVGEWAKYRLLQEKKYIDSLFVLWYVNRNLRKYLNF